MYRKPNVSHPLSVSDSESTLAHMTCMHAFPSRMLTTNFLSSPMIPFSQPTSFDSINLNALTRSAVYQRTSPSPQLPSQCQHGRQNGMVPIRGHSLRIINHCNLHFLLFVIVSPYTGSLLDGVLFILTNPKYSLLMKLGLNH